jgi:hypothetical protein
VKHGALLGLLARQETKAKFVMAMMVVRRGTASLVASALNPNMLPEPYEKRIKRFCKEITELTRLMGERGVRVLNYVQYRLQLMVTWNNRGHYRLSRKNPKVTRCASACAARLSKV